jgi:hypothetical protein
MGIFTMDRFTMGSMNAMDDDFNFNELAGAARPEYHRLCFGE